MKQWKLLLTSNGEDLGKVDVKRERYFKETVFRHCCLFSVWYLCR